ncbi:unnamed protein product, partial [Heterosigma akashiwo]
WELEPQQCRRGDIELHGCQWEEHGGAVSAAGVVLVQYICTCAGNQAQVLSISWTAVQARLERTQEDSSIVLAGPRGPIHLLSRWYFASGGGSSKERRAVVLLAIPKWSEHCFLHVHQGPVT